MQAMRAILAIVALSACTRPATLADAGVDPFRLATINIANGAGDRFRTTEKRQEQAAFLKRAGIHVAGLQEVDVGADRSGNGHTALQIAVALEPGFAGCGFDVGTVPPMAIDGTSRCRSNEGSVLFSTAFRADDPFHVDDAGNPSGIIDADDTLNPKGTDRGADAFFGNALIVLAPLQVPIAYTVALPGTADEVLSPELLSAAAAEDAPHLSALAAHNVALRRRPGIEPRSVLVARVERPAKRTISILTTHLESAGGDALRAAQLNAVVALAAAERGSDRSRAVVIMGDFNMRPHLAGTVLVPAGFRLAQSSADAGSGLIDQIWLDASLALEQAEELPTQGASDHTYAVAATVKIEERTTGGGK